MKFIKTKNWNLKKEHLSARLLIAPIQGNRTRWELSVVSEGFGEHDHDSGEQLSIYSS